MITEIHYKNFKALRDATLSLGRFTLIVGANGTGKTSAMKALEKAKNPHRYVWKDVVSVNEYDSRKQSVLLNIITTNEKAEFIWEIDEEGMLLETLKSNEPFDRKLAKMRDENYKSFKLYIFDSDEIAAPVDIQPNIELGESGKGLAGVLDLLRDSYPEKFEDLNKELNNWFGEYDRILFEVPNKGQKSFLLRTRFGKHKIKAQDLSHGTLLALAYLTIAYLPNPPKIVAFEEPEHGIHPRLLRNIQEAMDRLAYPENYGEKREPVQVIATTHSPYLLDLYKDRREEIVIADKDENGVHFERLTDLPNIEKILQEQDAPLGDVWFSGVLGGVPAQI